MSFEIEKATLGDFLKFKNGKTSPERADDASFPVFGSNGLIGRAESTNCPEKTIIIGRVGSYCGSIHFSKERCWVSDNAISCSSKNAGEEHFWFYVLTKLNLNQFSSGSGQPLLNQATLNAVECQVPSSPSFRALIGGVLNDFDKKIKLNTQTNQTLEEMAQAIFKSWFVDFDPVKAKMNGEQPEGMDEATASLFPEKLVESELGLIPEGWGIAKIKDFGTVVCGKTPSKAKPDFYGGSIPFIKIPDTHGKVFITETTDTLTEAGDESQPKKRIPANSICVSCIATVGKVFITTRLSHTNQQINAVIPNDIYSLYYMLFSFKDFNKHFHDLASGGSATLNMNTSTFSNIDLVQPSSKILEAFHKTVNGLMQKMLANQLENTTLAMLRDTLLPKLLSGEIEFVETTI
ncbi:restriction endonuclease subunit S [Shewanella oncorhynchi]|uniref:restriction endonuclease subunit S n=1 Tax=Shewanella oncorhynchi TaxID=2726434 RepID=UPI003D7984DD